MRWLYQNKSRRFVEVIQRGRRRIAGCRRVEVGVVFTAFAEYNDQSQGHGWKFMKLWIIMLREREFCALFLSHAFMQSSGVATGFSSVVTVQGLTAVCFSIIYNHHPHIFVHESNICVWWIKMPRNAQEMMKKKCVTETHEWARLLPDFLLLFFTSKELNA